MTSCVLTLSFSLALFSSSAAAVDATGLKIKVTDKGKDVLKDLGLACLDKLVNREFSGPSWTIFKVERVMLTSLNVNPDDVVFNFVENNGVQFAIETLAFTGKVGISASVINTEVEFGAAQARMMLIAKLNRNQQGQFNVEMRHCDMNIAVVQIKSVELRTDSDPIRKYVIDWLNAKLCSLVESYIVPPVNTMLEKMTMVKTLDDFKENLSLNIHIDYSLSGDPEVTSHGLTVPFKGLLFVGKTDDTSSIRAGADPVITETDQTVYVGVSEFVFNSAAMALYNSEKAYTVEFPFQLMLSEPPIVSITEKGLSANVKATAHSEHQPETFLSVTCQVDLNVNIKGNRLVLDSRNAKCNPHDRSKPVKWAVKKVFKRKIKNLLKTWFDEGLPIRLPEGVVFTDGNVKYHKGFVVVGGDLNLTPAGRQTFLKYLGI